MDTRCTNMIGVVGIALYLHIGVLGTIMKKNNNHKMLESMVCRMLTESHGEWTVSTGRDRSRALRRIGQYHEVLTLLRAMGVSDG